MLNYLKSEIYHLVHRKGPYLFILISSALLIAMNVVLHQCGVSDSKFSYDTTSFAFSNIYSNMHVLLMLCVTVSAIIFGEEYEYHTFKNSISFGISRKTIFTIKMIVQIIYSIIAFTIIIGCLIGSGYLLLQDSGTAELGYLVKSSLAGIPFFIFALAVYTVLYAIFEKTGLSIGLSAVILIVIPVIINEFAQKFEFAAKIAKYIPLNMVTDYNFEEAGFTASWLIPGGIAKYYAIGLAYSVITFLVGFVIFNKKEIK